MTALVTGGAGFIGSHLVAHILANTAWDVVILDRLDVSGNLNRLVECETFQRGRQRVRFVWHDLKAPISDQLSQQIGRVDYVFHLAASTHVDRSISDPLPFVYDNVIGSAHALEFARVHGVQRFFYMGTDEVFGPAPEGTAYLEWDRYNSGNPYSAAKAGGEELCLAYHNTYGVPVVVGHCMNVFGERQHVEKFVPGTILKVRDGRMVTIHANKDRTKAGSRFYIHARNVADALLFIVKNGAPGEKFNIVGEREVSNLEMAQHIAEIQGKALRHELVDYHSSRPGHDLRYALDGSKLAAMGWKPPVSFAQSLEHVVKWTLAHPNWLLG